jgi:2,4-dienoyl-CoA reductase-like NADH-dependent reductase (Old Yellow Enzyme family)
MNASSLVFTPYTIKGLSLKNRLIMAPLFVGYADREGAVTPLVIDHYREMAASGVSLVVVENASVDPSGSGSPYILRVDHDRYISGLAELAGIIHDQGALAFLQLNHAGRYAYPQERFAPSPVKTGKIVPREMSLEEIRKVVQAFADGARRVKEAGFDGVEIHGGTGYLIVQFLSPRTNRRQDAYGGSLENRMRFPLEVVDAVLGAVGGEYPVGYRFLADEWLPDGLHPQGTIPLAGELEKRGLAYLSVTAGTYDSFALPKYVEAERSEGYMAHFAGEIKASLAATPVVAAGRIQSPSTAEKILGEGQADLVGLARVLFADPLWPRKAQGEVSDPIVPCEPACSLCNKRVGKAKPAFCSQWDKGRREAFLERIGEKEDGRESKQAERGGWKDEK